MLLVWIAVVSACAMTLLWMGVWNAFCGRVRHKVLHVFTALSFSSRFSTVHIILLYWSFVVGILFDAFVLNSIFVFVLISLCVCSCCVFCKDIFLSVLKYKKFMQIELVSKDSSRPREYLRRRTSVKNS